MKIKIVILFLLVVVVITSCKKNNDTVEKYSSLKDFYNQNGVAMQTFTVDAATGGTFITPQGTVVTIPANAFVTLTGGSVSGTVTVEFKDLYKKSDLLFSGLPTETYSGQLLKSAGEFFIRATVDAAAVKIAAGKQIDVNQPMFGDSADFNMQAFIALPLQPNGGLEWGNDSNSTPASLLYNTTNYIFSLYQFTSPQDSGTWCNSDNPSFFSAYPNITLTIHPNDTGNYFTDVFLLFEDVNSMIHVYKYGTDYPYYYAPSGFNCSVVAVGIKDSTLYSAFVPITIGSSNQTVNFSLSQTTEEEFKAQLEELN